MQLADVDGLNDALAHTALTPVRMTNANHVLKDVGDRPSTGPDYVEPLPLLGGVHRTVQQVDRRSVISSRRLR